MTDPVVEEVKKVPVNISEKYYNLSEDEIQKLVEDAKLNKRKAQEELLKIFDNFITKYCSLLYKGKFDLRDYDIRKFISLYIVDKPSRIRLARNQLNGATYRNVNETIRGINFMVQRYNQPIDVRQTVQLTFLQCVSKYKRKDSIPFSGYIYNYFYFLLSRNVNKFLIYQLGRHSFPLYTDDDVTSSSHNESDEVNQVTILLTPSIEDLLGPEEIDEYWVLGETCIFPFDRLTTQQRQLIKWRYVDKLKASKVAVKTTEHPNTVRAQLTTIRDELVSILENE